MMKKKVISAVLLCTIAVLAKIGITRNWGGKSTASKELPLAIELVSHVGPSHFTPNGIYELENADLPTYIDKKGCVITNIQGLESCGERENCKEKCFGKESMGACYEGFCTDQKRSPPTIFLDCSKYGPHTCTNADYVPYEDSNTEGFMIKNTDKFTISDVSSHYQQSSFWEIFEDFGMGKIEVSLLFVFTSVLLLGVFIDITCYKVRKRGILHYLCQKSEHLNCSRTQHSISDEADMCQALDKEQMDMKTPLVQSKDIVENKSFDNARQQRDWDDVIKTTFNIVLEQTARGRAFTQTISNTLGIGGYYQEWLMKNNGANEKRDLIDKVNEILQLWNDHFHHGSATRNNLVEDLEKNQHANDCIPLIAALRRKNLETNVKNMGKLMRTFSWPIQ